MTTASQQPSEFKGMLLHSKPSEFKGLLLHSKPEFFEAATEHARRGTSSDLAAITQAIKDGKYYLVASVTYPDDLDTDVSAHLERLWSETQNGLDPWEQEQRSTSMGDVIWADFNGAVKWLWVAVSVGWDRLPEAIDVDHIKPGTARVEMEKFTNP